MNNEKQETAQLIKYICAHCGHQFESSETKDIECPQCFWSTSIKRDDGLPIGKVQPPQDELDDKFSEVGLTIVAVFGFLVRGVFFIGLGIYGHNLLGNVGDTPFSALTLKGLMSFIFGLGLMIYSVLSIFKPVSAWGESDYDYKLLYSGWGFVGLGIIGIVFLIFHKQFGF